MPTWGGDPDEPTHWVYRAQNPGPGQPEMIFLPTKPATQIEWSTEHRWPVCWICRILGILRAWKTRNHHMDKRHRLVDYIPEDT